MNSISSPCLKICKIDRESQLCQGCFRSLEEIAAWRNLSEEERVRIMQQVLPRRKEEFYQSIGS
ncbi:MAG: DUF1289 domain-containing protein [bacterium]